MRKRYKSNHGKIQLRIKKLKNSLNIKDIHNVDESQLKDIDVFMGYLELLKYSTMKECIHIMPELSKYPLSLVNKIILKIYNDRHKEGFYSELITELVDEE